MHGISSIGIEVVTECFVAQGLLCRLVHSFGKQCISLKTEDNTNPGALESEFESFVMLYERLMVLEWLNSGKIE
ncbi:hypothetical protein RJZ57_001057 [Blastomyces gilchristii]